MEVIFTLVIAAAIISLCLTPQVRSLSQRLGFVDRPDGWRKIHTGHIPRVGGLAIAVSYVLAFAVAYYLVPQPSPIGFAFKAALRLAPAGIFIFLVGFYDDIYELRAPYKLAAQLIAATWAFSMGVRASFAAVPLDSLASLVVTVGWLVLCMNAVNLIDGLDGLAGGVAMIAAVTMLLAGILHGNTMLVIMAAPLIGGLLGFLPYNVNPASVFLGDGGSLFIGFLLGCFGAAWSEKSVTLAGLAGPLMALCIPLLDTTLAIVRRFLRNEPIFGADRSHIHHKLLDQGLHPRRAVLIFYGAGIIAGVFALGVELVPPQAQGIGVALFLICLSIPVYYLAKVEVHCLKDVLGGRLWRRWMGLHVRRVQLEQALEGKPSLEQRWETLVAAIPGTDFHTIRLETPSRVFEHRSTTVHGEPSCRLETTVLDTGRLIILYSGSPPHLPYITSYAQMLGDVITPPQLTVPLRKAAAAAGVRNGAPLFGAPATEELKSNIR